VGVGYGLLNKKKLENMEGAFKLKLKGKKEVLKSVREKFSV